ncbi:hypothetical protein NLM33_47640 (plasmid) [Bradyrhizobium sp. CCGUVB1N3]|uniref:DUF6036 family nucleotidyltransferase n=1 Tax=Bradyrhizobium sp. CCGUVB1N3 TaxID=2949629 RepID=UPI0020B2BEDE|nr:DUF6036 family nucleotidyltransferase [Bradyrhizobium sp. CCGUVB1N3]MCP3477786.1 hypothetical protein [Bradyrhizobium sp. CCGUVB1N3]
MTQNSFVRTIEDLVETVRVIARLFKTDKVFIIGSQSILLSWPDAPVVLRTSGEIDAYPENAKIWEIQQKELDPEDDPEASEEINALYGEGSKFHREHGFYIDGVDENTARLPDDWNKRTITKTVDVDDRKVLAVAPCPEDIIVSKLARLSDKDKEFVEGYHQARPFDRELVVERIKATKLEAELQKRAINFVRDLADTPKADAAAGKTVGS